MRTSGGPGFPRSVNIWFNYQNDSAINDLGEVAYQRVGGRPIFLGSQFVISNGDTISFLNSPLTGQVVSLSIGDTSLDDAGTIAFQYELASGTQGIAIAVIPEPSTVLLVALGLMALTLRTRNQMRIGGKSIN